jgi:hypothetical protein
VSITVPANPTVSNPIGAALEALKAGKDPEAAVFGSGGSASSPEFNGESQADSSDPMDAVSEGDGTAAPTEDSSDASSDSSVEAPEPEMEDILISDADGSKKKITVDWNDRAKLKTYVQKLYGAQKGMRQHQSRADQAEAKLKTIEPEYQDLKSSWKSVEEAFQKEGVKGLVNLLSGQANGYDSLIEQEYQRRFAKAEAKRLGDTNTLDRMELEERLQNEKRERERLSKQVQEQLAKVDSEREQAQILSLESKVTPAFEKHRFAGRLGDPTVEHQLDTAVWQQAMARLEEYPDTVEMTPALIEKEFRTVAASFNKIISRQAEQKVDQTLKQKKAAAAETAAATATKGMRTSSEKEAFATNIKNGRIVDAFKQFASGKIRL